MEKKVSIRGRLEECGLRVTVPAEADREIIHRVIFEELCHGRFLDVSRSEYIRVIEGLAKQGVEGVILGCTEIGLLGLDGYTSRNTPLFDTAKIHAEAAARHALDV